MSKGVVLMISNDFPPVSGGQSRYLYDLWSCLPAEEVVIMAPEIDGAEEVDAALRCRVVRVPLRLQEGRFSKLYKTKQLLVAAWKFCRQNNVRQIHCGQMFSTGFTGYWCRLLLGIPYCVYAYGADLLEFDGRLGWGQVLRQILRRADKLIAISKFTRECLLESGVAAERIDLIYPALDLERFTGTIDRAAARDDFGWDGKQVVLSIGRLVERKGQDTVIRALSAVAEKIPTVHYAIGSRGPYRQALEQLAVDEGVAERVEFIGFVDEADLGRRYAAADLFSMVSREIDEVGEVEGFGIVYLEANAVGTAVLAGRSGGVEDAVADGQSGLLVDPEDLDAVVAAIVRLLQDDDLRHRLGAEGQQRVRAEF
ncbi:MAG: glycosyltransferase family 4 protein, partial [Gemmatimonadetes bacterium]|nr:glycosyltransferase family 4 protein [Gemmatimonadota bacterium]